MGPSEFTMNPSEFQIRHIPSLVAICLLVLECVATWRFEFTYIWRRPLNTYKVAFVVSRYLEITGKIAHYCLIHLVLGRSPHGISPRRCAIWYSILFVQCAAMVLILDVILFLRVYALYQRNPLTLLLTLPLMLPGVLGAFTNWYLMRHARESFDSVCNARFYGTMLALGVVISTSFVVAHGLLWVCVYIRRNVGQGSVPVVRLVVHEGAWIFIFMLAISTACINTDVVLGAVNPFVHFVCPSTLISIVNCRIIKNMHGLAVDSGQAPNITRSTGSACDDDAFRLTTFFITDTAIEIDPPDARVQLQAPSTP